MPNKCLVSIIGHLGKDAETKFVPSGDAVTEFSVAVNTSRDKEAKPTWFRCSMWGKRGESVKPFLLKGKAVSVDGSMIARDYTTNDGRSGSSLEVRVNELVLLGSKGEAEPAPQPPLDSDVPF